jgi:hypothetical protein
MVALQVSNIVSRSETFQHSSPDLLHYYVPRIRVVGYLFIRVFYPVPLNCVVQ